MSKLNNVIDEVIVAKYASNIQRVLVNQLISIPPDIHEKTRVFLLKSGVTEVH